MVAQEGRALLALLLGWCVGTSVVTEGPGTQP